MAKGIEEEFDWDDYHRDTRMLSLDAKGAWWDCLYQMRISSTRGRISMPLSSYAIMFGASPIKAQKVLNEIGEREVGDVVTERNKKITVTNRRMFRQWQEREGNKHRQSEFRKRKSNNGHNGNVTNDEKTPLVVVEEIHIKKEKKLRQKVSATRIPDPFPLTDEMIDWATKELPGLRVIEAHENFVEYYTNLTTSKAEKVDWDLTWKKGMKLALRWQKSDGSATTNKDVGRSDPDRITEPDPPCEFCGEDICFKDHRAEIAA